MRMTSISRPQVGWGKFILLALLYLVFTVFVVAVLFRGFKVSSVFNVGIFGIGIPDLVYLAGLGFIGFLIQHKLSAAYGTGRLADMIVSLPMLVAIALAFLLWAGFPIITPVLVWISSLVGYPFESTPNEYKVGGALIFAFYALIDLGRDWFGIGRRSNFRYHGGTGVDPAGIRREDLVTGAHGDLPDRTTVVSSRSGVPEFENQIPIRHVFVHYVYDPRTGRDVLIPHAPTPRSAIRVAETLSPPTRTPDAGIPTGGTT